jgi:diguanylate cyclase (GGDEF)-like protein/PAS domain S-box-containing protein
MAAGAPPPNELRQAARVSGGIAIGFGAAILTGWVTGLWVLTRISPGLPAAMPGTGLMLIGCGASLVLAARPAPALGTRIAATAVAALVFVIAAATLVEHIAGVSLGVDLRIGHGYGGVPHPGRPGPHTATAFLLLAACLVLARWRTGVGEAVTSVLGALAALSIGLAVAGYLVGVKYLYGSDHVHGMSVNTAAALVVLLAGVFALRPETPPGSWFAGSGGGDAAARRLMAPALALPFVAGAFAQAGASVGLYSERFAIALMVVLFAATIQGLIFLAVRTVREHEHDREERTALVVDRIAEAVSIIGPDGRHLHVNDAARLILDDLRQRYEAGPLGDLSWGAIDTDGSPMSADALPAEVTRTSGREVDERVVGFPGSAGDIRWLRISTRKLSSDGPPFSVVASFVDVTAQRHDADRLDEAEYRFELAFHNAPIGVCVVSLEGQMVQVNPALCEMIGFSQEELLSTTFQELTATNDIKADVVQLRRLVAGEIASYAMEKRYLHKDQSVVWALVTVAAVRDHDGNPLHFIAQILDVTERRSLERQLRHQADHDMLTGLANRRAFAAELARELGRERRYGGESSLLMIDLDGFKEVNDTLGHAAGDLLLQAIAYSLAERMRDTDMVARLGGDEFAALLPSTPRDGAEVLAIDIVQAIRDLSLDIGDGRRAAVTASVGIASSAELSDEADEDSLLAAADLAMYDAKRRGRDGYAVHST